MKPILEIHKLSKKYTIQHEHLSYLTLRDRLASGLMKGRSTNEEFWALKNVDLELSPGDTLGIIGKNGAGKSTLLKILSKITPPSEGKIISRGRMASLLEVGTGFHPELTGRENVYLNGSILGMRKRVIDARFDEIVSFAGTEQFLDTPLKHYSIGMALRLAFSVAANLEPEILVIDEVLSVGDAEFQRKCLRKMETVSKSGRTILFVSHNMEAVRSLCNKCVLLEKGVVKHSGTTEEVILEYFKGLSRDQRTSHRPSSPIRGNGMELIECSVSATPIDHTAFINGQDLRVNFKIKNTAKKKFSLHLFVFRDESLAFISSDLHDPCADKLAKDQETFNATFIIPPYLLNPGHCRMGLMIADYNGNTEQFFNQMDLLNFQVEDDGVRRGNRYSLGWSGAVSPMLKIFPN